MPQSDPKSLATHAGPACSCSQTLFLAETKNHIAADTNIALIYHNFRLVTIPCPTNGRDAGVAGADGQHNVKCH
jgi:hypothetical protein